LADRLRYRDVPLQSDLAHGLWFNSGHSNASYLLEDAEPDIQQALMKALRPGASFYDVGANMGLLSVLAARKVGDGGTVISVEPLPVNVELIRHNLALNKFRNTRVAPVALGDIDGCGDFLVSNCSSWGMLAGMQREPGEMIGKTSVEIRRLDSVMSEEGWSAPTVIKIDVEGAESRVLAGAPAVLGKCRPLLFIEVHDTAAAISRQLSEYDYAVCRFGRKSADPQVHGNYHVFAIPRERGDRELLFEEFTKPSFPLCPRCAEAPCEESPKSN
jgi:FkbM family methyltransferase